MNKIVVGISPRFSYNENTKRSFLSINVDYLNALIKHNAIPLVLYPGSNLEAMLKQCDGFLVIGGDDINPVYYNEENTHSNGINDLEDETDKKIIEYAVSNKIPLFGICRGIQALAAFLNGSLYQDIYYSNLSHPECEKKHEVIVANHTRLTKLLPEKFLVNTFHHQAVKAIPDDFVVTFKNGDVIEAIEHKYLPIFGVQWHPERYYTNESIIMFDYFIDLIKAKKQ